MIGQKYSRIYIDLGDEFAVLNVKKFKSFRTALAIVAFVLIFCLNPLRAEAEGYITQNLTVKSDNASLRIGGGDMFIVAGKAVKGENFTAQSHYVDASGKVWFEVERGGRRLWLAKDNCIITNSLQKIPVRQFSRENLPTIYLSPSRQPHNLYAVGGTNEMEQMEVLTAVTADILREKYGFKVYVAPSYMRIIKSGRPSDASRKGCDVYLAIHSNATASGKKCSGAEGYYYSGSEQSKQLAENIVRELNSVSDYPPVDSAGAVSAMESFDNFGYGEVRDPSDLGMIAVLAEVDYHDNPDTAKMIINQRQRIAEALAKAIAETFYR